MMLELTSSLDKEPRIDKLCWEVLFIDIFMQMTIGYGENTVITPAENHKKIL
jgi:hypothetical protein